MKHFIYYFSEKYDIFDLEYCDKSENTLDINIYDLANNKFLLNKLNLVYLGNSFGNYNTDDDRFRFFCSYLTDFFSPNIEGMRDKLKSNIKVRILFKDGTKRNDIIAEMEKYYNY
jgi:hypothetical protein